MNNNEKNSVPPPGPQGRHETRHTTMTRDELVALVDAMLRRPGWSGGVGEEIDRVLGARREEVADESRQN